MGPSGLVMAIGAALVAIAALAGRDHETPIRTLAWRHRWFILVVFAFPVCLIAVLDIAAATGPIRAVAIGGAVFLALGLGRAYLGGQPGLVRRAFIGTAAYTAGLIAATLIWPS